MQQSDVQQQPWKIRVDVKAKNFNFKFKGGTHILPTLKLFPFSVKLKIGHSILKVKSEPQPQSQLSWFLRKPPTKSLKSKFLRMFMFMFIFHPRRNQSSDPLALFPGNLFSFWKDGRRTVTKLMGSNSILAILVCCAIVSRGGYVSYCTWKAWNFAASFHLASFWQYMGADNGTSIWAI